MTDTSLLVLIFSLVCHVIASWITIDKQKKIILELSLDKLDWFQKAKALEEELKQSKEANNDS